jgi:cell division protein FtsB
MLQVAKRIVITILAVTAILLLFTYVFHNKNFDKYKSLEMELDRVSQMNNTLTHENGILRKKIKAFHSNRSFIEKIVRDELGMIQTGEIIYQFPKKNFSD